MIRRLKRWWLRQSLQGAYRQAIALLHQKYILERYGYDRTDSKAAMLARHTLEGLIDQVEHCQIQLMLADVPIPHDCECIARHIMELAEDMKRLERCDW